MTDEQIDRLYQACKRIALEAGNDLEGTISVGAIEDCVKAVKQAEGS